MDDEFGLGELVPGQDYPRWFPVVGGDEDGIFIDLPGFDKWSPFKEKPKPKPAKAAARRGSPGLGDLGALEGGSGISGLLTVGVVVGAGLLLWKAFGSKSRKRR